MESKKMLEKKLAKKNKLDLNDFMEINVKIFILFVSQVEKEKVANLKSEKLDVDKNLNEQKSVNNKKIFYLEEQMALVKTQWIFIKNIQKEYYMNLLKKGDDCRGKGIVWIIKQMWDLELRVYKTMLPDCLDEASKQFLIDVR